ncbi:MAG TPA: L,D-transpeptidase [Trichocoleus sp.]
MVSLTWMFWLYFSPQITLQALFGNNAANEAASDVGSVTSASVTEPAVSPLADQFSSAPVDPTVEPNRIEIDLSDRTITLYRQNAKVNSYPIGIGRLGWETPVGQYRVLQMRRNPSWINPLTDQYILPGDPENPLGAYWIGFWTNGRDWIGVHGTPERNTVGEAISHGCIRMYNEDIEELYKEANLGRQVIVKQ